MIKKRIFTKLLGAVGNGGADEDLFRSVADGMIAEGVGRGGNFGACSGPFNDRTWEFEVLIGYIRERSSVNTVYINSYHPVLI